MSLKEYRKKRDFTVTKEPKASGKRDSGSHRFVIQKHDASHLHYDFRLEMAGTLKSWAVPKGVPMVRGEKRLAVEVEDHPISYGNFEGTIPKGQYGGGTVMVWDFGTFNCEHGDPSKEWKAGKLEVRLDGTKLQGVWHLVRLKQDRQWLIIKGDGGRDHLGKKAELTSALSGRTMEQIAEGASPGKASAKPARQRTAVKAPRPTKEKSHPAAKSEFHPPMLAKSVTKAPLGSWLFELKHDGYRALLVKQGSKVQLLSRNEITLNDKFPEIAEEAQKLRVDDAVIDGEIVALDDRGRSSFQTLQAYALGEQNPPLLYYAFDVLQTGSKNWMHYPLETRRSELQRILPHRGLLRFSETLGSDLELILPKIRELGLEGVIGKRPGSLYESGKRSGAWIKIKVVQQQEVVIGGYTNPQGNRPKLGALLVGVYQDQKLHFAGKVGTGFNHHLLTWLEGKLSPLQQEKSPFVDLHQAPSGRHSRFSRSALGECHWVDPRLVCQVKFTEWTRDGKLRHPVFLGLREDKPATEVVREAEPTDKSRKPS